MNFTFLDMANDTVRVILEIQLLSFIGQLFTVYYHMLWGLLIFSALAKWGFYFTHIPQELVQVDVAI